MCAKVAPHLGGSSDNGLQEIHEEIEGTFIEKSGLRCRGWAVGDSVEYNLNCIGFADDTTTLGKVKDKQHVIDMVRRIFSTNGEEAHPGKDEFLIPCKYVDPSLQPDKWHKASVRLLGGRVDQDEGCRADTRHRLLEAGHAWGKIKRHITLMRGGPQNQGTMTEAIVCSTLCYAAEVRPFTSVEILAYQRFLNKVVRYLVWSEYKIGIQDMENTYTNEQFFSWCGLRSAKNYIYSRTWQYLGHLGRYSDDRIELLMLGSRLKLLREELCHSSSVRVSLREWYKKRLMDFFKRISADTEWVRENWREHAEEDC